MANIRRRVKLTKDDELRFRFFMDEDIAAESQHARWLAFRLSRPAVAEAAWREVADKVLGEWIEARPGTRPSHWWRFDAPRQPAGLWAGCHWDGRLPEPRLRLGGSGTPAHEVLNVAPAFPCGVPASWYGVDATDPPQFESQASYLERHNAFLPGERERLGEADYLPEIVEPETIYQ